MTDAATAHRRRPPTIRVTPAAVSQPGIAGGGGHIGSPHPVTLIAYDPYGNVATELLRHGAPHGFRPGDGPSRRRRPLVNGYATVPVTPMTLGSQTLTATDVADPAMTATETIVGTPGDAARVEVTSISNAVAGTVQSLTVTAYDAFGNVAVDYAGTVAFSSTDPIASHAVLHLHRRRRRQPHVHRRAEDRRDAVADDPRHRQPVDRLDADAAS